MEGGPCEAACGETRAGRRTPEFPAVGRMPSGVVPKAHPREPEEASGAVGREETAGVLHGPEERAVGCLKKCVAINRKLQMENLKHKT